MANADVPILRQNVRWGEEYVSRALNIKFGGILQSGIYEGFVLKPGGGMTVLVDHGDDSSRSIAVVERDGYSLTVIMDDPGTVSIPASGEWFVCIEAFYAPTRQGYQRIVVREKTEPHHVVLGKVYVAAGKPLIITKDMISAEKRQEGGINILQSKMTAASAELSANILRLSNRVTRLEQSWILSTGSFSGLENDGDLLSPRGYPIAGGKVAPVTILPESSPLVPGAALTMVVSSPSKP